MRLALVWRFADIYTRECLLGFIFDITRDTPTHERERDPAERGDGGGCKRKLRTARTGQARARGTAGGTRSDARRRYKTRAKQTRNRRICAMTGVHRGTASCSHAPDTDVAIGPRHIDIPTGKAYVTDDIVAFIAFFIRGVKSIKSCTLVYMWSWGLISCLHGGA